MQSKRVGINGAGQFGDFFVFFCISHVRYDGEYGHESEYEHQPTIMAMKCNEEIHEIAPKISECEKRKHT